MGKPTLTFRKRNGGTFRKTFKSISSAKRAIAGWRSAGGQMAKAIRTRWSGDGKRATWR